ncbi:hypothetical protein AB0J43_30095 [Nonomuraea fuscirosea]
MVRQAGPARARPLWVVCALGVLAVSMIAGLLDGAADISPWQVVLQMADWLPFVHVDSGLAPVDLIERLRSTPSNAAFLLEAQAA